MSCRGHELKITGQGGVITSFDTEKHWILHPGIPNNSNEVAFLSILFVRAIPKVKDAHVPTR